MEQDTCLLQSVVSLCQGFCSAPSVINMVLVYIYSSKLCEAAEANF